MIPIIAPLFSACSLYEKQIVLIVLCDDLFLIAGSIQLFVMGIYLEEMCWKIRVYNDNLYRITSLPQKHNENYNK